MLAYRPLPLREQGPGQFQLHQALYRDIIDNCADGVVIVSADHIIAYMNSSALAMFGYAGENLVGQPLSMLIPREYRASHAALVDGFRDSQQGGRFMEGRRMQTYGRNSDGSAFPVSVSILKSGRGSTAALVAIVRDITEQKMIENELARLASIDPLTGILNRRTFLLRAEEECARSQRHKHPMAIAMLDIDHFKSINDRYGHAVGDRAIRHVADTVAARLRKPDVFGRWGGEEFALLLPDTDEDNALNLAQRLRQDVEQSPLGLEASHEPPLCMAVSIGVAGFEQCHASMKEALDRADLALYLAKGKGRNRVCSSSDVIPRTAREGSRLQPLT